MPRPPAKRMSADELVRGRVALNFTQADLARALYVHPETVYQWETGRRSIPGPVQAWLHIMLRPNSRKRMRRDADLTKAKAKLAAMPAPVIEHEWRAQHGLRPLDDGLGMPQTTCPNEVCTHGTSDHNPDDPI
jgi:hypothetical protein